MPREPVCLRVNSRRPTTFIPIWGTLSTKDECLNTQGHLHLDLILNLGTLHQLSTTEPYFISICHPLIISSTNSYRSAGCFTWSLSRTSRRRRGGCWPRRTSGGPSPSVRRSSRKVSWRRRITICTQRGQGQWNIIVFFEEKKSIYLRLLSLTKSSWALIMK